MATINSVPGSPSDSRAAIGNTVSARLDANPVAQRLPSLQVAAWRVANFLNARACRRLITMIDKNRRPSTLLSDRGDATFRTSESCDMDRWSDSVQPIDESIANLLGIAPENGETMQGQRYAPGQHFRAHHDYFHQGESYWERIRQAGGQRTWTAMIYLNDVEDGGATWFPQAGLRVAPRQGLLLTWDNMAADGSPNPMTIHEGTEVVEGVKYIVTKWFREERWLAG